MRGWITAAYDGIEAFWESARTRRAVAAALVVVFVGTVISIELGRRGLLPASLAGRLPANHFAGVGTAFSLLLAFEVVGLVFAVSHSISVAAGKQLEIFSLILLRHSFEEFGHLPEPFTWESARDADILMVLVSLRYSASYLVLFRNSGLAVATVLLRIGLSAPPYANAALGLAAAVFALALTVASTRLAPYLCRVEHGPAEEERSRPTEVAR